MCTHVCQSSCPNNDTLSEDPRRRPPRRRSETSVTSQHRCRRGDPENSLPVVGVLRTTLYRRTKLSLSEAEATAARLQAWCRCGAASVPIRRDHAGDLEALIGQAKELIETTCKTTPASLGRWTGRRAQAPRPGE